MTPTLTPAAEIRTGDLLECADQVFRPVVSIEKQYGRLYFHMGCRRDTRTALIDDVLMVGRKESL